jgi:SnoaL-like polyketide cyclase
VSISPASVNRHAHSGPFWGIPPTGRRIEIDKKSIFRVAGNRIAERWCMFDELGRLRQLGVGGQARITLRAKSRASGTTFA